MITYRQECTTYLRQSRVISGWYLDSSLCENKGSSKGWNILGKRKRWETSAIRLISKFIKMGFLRPRLLLNSDWISIFNRGWKWLQPLLSQIKTFSGADLRAMSSGCVLGSINSREIIIDTWPFPSGLPAERSSWKLLLSWQNRIKQSDDNLADGSQRCWLLTNYSVVQLK